MAIVRLYGRTLAAGAALLALSAGPPAAFANGPVLRGGAGRGECGAALAMARTSFLSDSASLFWPVPAAAGADDAVVLARARDDISRGNGVRADPGIFARIVPAGGQVVSLYWQRELAGGHRTAVIDEKFNWQGDWYYLFDLDARVSQEELLGGYHSADASARGIRLVFGSNRWTPPVILRNKASGKLWAVDQGEIFQIMPAWRVVAGTPGGLANICRVDFTSDANPGLTRLPPSVQQFARLSDEALGSGGEEGTLQPAGAIRRDVARDWAIIGYRPWGLSDRPYNSRAEINTGLAGWVRARPERASLLRAIFRSSDEATRELAAFYQQHFGLTGDAAGRFSRFAMDHMLRRYFVFRHEGSDPDPEPVPWPRVRRSVDSR